MADVMPRGHGGDGAGDPPLPDGFRPGSHEQDLVPRKKTRGKAKNEGLDRELKKRKGRPLSIPFDDCTHHPVGKPCDYFTREVALYIWKTIPLDREGWRNVDEPEKNALDEYIKTKFNLDEVAKDINASKIQGGIRQVIQKRYSDRKNKAKTKFLEAGGYGDVEGARSKVPEDMTNENWQKAINHFLTPAHIKRSATNKECRAKQKYNYRGGTRSYASRCYKEGLQRIEAFYKTNTNKEGIFLDPIAEKEYHDLVAEYDTYINQQPGDEDGKVDDVAIFEKALGSRRGHVKGIGPIPCSSKKPVVGGVESQTPQFSKSYFKEMFKNKEFRAELKAFLSEETDEDGTGDDGSEDYGSGDDLDLT